MFFHFCLAALFCCLISNNALAQKVYETNSRYDADVKVYETDSRYDADEEGRWFFTDSRYDADLKIYYCSSRYDAGWKNEEKRKLME